jgi:precorrin-2/cobalt-factor-2 C20-methyltransferase
MTAMDDGEARHLLRSSSSGKLMGVGVGPGDPGLLTIRAYEVLRSADVVTVPTVAAGVVGRAEAVVATALPDRKLERLVIEMPSPRRGTREDATDASYRHAANRIATWLRAGSTVAFATLGDPNVYSTFTTLEHHVREILPDLASETVPGICAFQDLAAKSRTVLLDGNESMALVSARDGLEQLEAALREPDRAIVVYKGGNRAESIRALLAQHGRLEGAMAGEMLGLPEERVVPLEEIREPLTYLASVVVPPTNRRREPRRLDNARSTDRCEGAP